MPRSTEGLIRELKTLMELSSIVNSTLDSSEIEKRAVEAVSSLVGAERGALLLVDPETGELCFEVALGASGGRLKEVRLPRGQGIAGWVVENATSAVVDDAQSDPRHFSAADETSRYVTKNLVCVPVFARGAVIGALEAINKYEGSFDDDDLELMETFADSVGIAIENAKLYENLKEAFYETAEALADTIEKRDPYTGGHTQRVMDYSVAIAEEMRLSPAETENVRLAAVLHDIGKIGVPDSVLLKTGPLDDDEYETMKGHCATASEIVAKVRHLMVLVPAIRSHHERVDGAGYPDHLKGEEIPLFARIISVADTFDAMTTDRPYRAGLSREAAIEELRKCADEQFDAEAVAAFIAVLRREAAPAEG